MSQQPKQWVYIGFPISGGNDTHIYVSADDTNVYKQYCNRSREVTDEHVCRVTDDELRTAIHVNNDEFCVQCLHQATEPQTI